jgi:hypothetical protein
MRPFISVVILVVIALVTVFIKMEVVRSGYEVLSLGHKTKILSEDSFRLESQYAKLTRPSRIDKIGTERLALGRIQKNQVIMMAADGEWSVRQ